MLRLIMGIRDFKLNDQDKSFFSDKSKLENLEKKEKDPFLKNEMNTLKKKQSKKY